MRTSRGSVAVSTVLGLLLAACVSQRGGPAAGIPQPATGKTASGSTPQPLPAGKPTNPPQFTPVAEANWDIHQPMVGHEIKCQNGKVLIFECQATNLLAFLPVDSIGGGNLSDIWGWTDSVTGREFALVGRNTGTAFVEITDPVNPRYLGDLPFHEGSRPSIWRDIKVYKHYAFIVSEGRAHGMQVFDLTQLRNVPSAPATFQETAHYDSISSAHNLVIDEATGFAYSVGNGGGGETCDGGLHMIDIRTPTQPTFVGCYPETLGGQRTRGYVHDAQCVVYQGPDQRYRGHEICLNSAEKALGIVDVTDKQRPKGISIADYPNVGYTHQGWLSEDQRYFFLGDEGDESLIPPGMTEHRWRTLVFDLSDLEQPVMLPEFFGTVDAGDHNMYVRGHYVYQSDYAAGLRILDISNPKALKEVGYFDPPDGESWSNYPYFTRNAGVVVFTNMNAGKENHQGLFIVRFVLAGM